MTDTAWRSVDGGLRLERAFSPGHAAALVAAIVSACAIVVTGCGGGHSDRVGHAPTRSVSTATPGQATDASPPPTTSRPLTTSQPLLGKFTAGPIAFADRRLGLLTINGFVGAGTEASSWQERTTDAGRTWVAGPVARTSDGRYPRQVATTQIDVAFASRTAAWASQPSLFYTEDGGASWRPEPGRLAGVGPVAVSGSSTWITGYPCRSFDCRPEIFRSDRVGGPLTRLPAQPTRVGDISTLLRPDQRAAWVLTTDSRGHQQLITTVDAGHSWHAEPAPCAAGDTMSIFGNHPSGLYLMCVAPSRNMCGQCGAHVLYRSTDHGGTWTRLTPAPTPAYSSTTPAQCLQPVGSYTVWAINQPPAGSGTVLRSIDGGQNWNPVLAGTTAGHATIETFLATDPEHAWLVTMSTSQAAGVGFTVYRTGDGGRTWQHSRLPIPANLH